MYKSSGWVSPCIFSGLIFLHLSIFVYVLAYCVCLRYIALYNFSVKYYAILSLYMVEMQFKEIGGKSRQTESSKVTEQPTEKKKGFGDWMNFKKPANEEKDHWVIIFFRMPDL